MSLRAMIWAFDQKVGSTPAKLVLLKLADHADHSGRCFPAIAHLAEHCEMHRSTVIRHLRKLEDLGFLNVKRSQHEGTSNTYMLAMNREQDAGGCSREQHPGVAESDRGCRTERQGGVAESDPNLSVGTSQLTNRESAPSAPNQTKAEKAHRLPEDWQPKVNHYGLGKELGLNSEDVDDEANAFRDHWWASSGQNARKRDWDRAFNNWLRKAKQFGRKPKQPQQPGNPALAAALRHRSRTASG